MNEQKHRDVHAHMTDLRRIADDLRLARDVRRAKSVVADGPAPPRTAVDQARETRSDRRAICPDDLPRTRPV